MKYLFVVTGFGYGDTIRSSAIIDELKGEVMILGYGFSYDYFKDKYKTLKIRSYNVLDEDMRVKAVGNFLRNFYLPLKWFYGFKKYREEIKKFNPDIIISDFEPMGNLLANSLNKKCVTVFGFNPELYKEYSDENYKLDIGAKFFSKVYEMSSIVIIPSFRKYEDRGNLRFISPIIKKKKLRDKKTIMKKLKLDREPILVMLGGSRYGKPIEKEIRRISRYFKDEKFIIFGGGKEFKENFLEYLKVSKAVITLGGQLTISECLYYRKPMIIFPIRDHVEQLLNAYQVKDYAIIKYDVKDLRKSLGQLLENREKYIRKIRNIKFTGGEEAAKIIKGLI